MGSRFRSGDPSHQVALRYGGRDFAEIPILQAHPITAPLLSQRKARPMKLIGGLLVLGALIGALLAVVEYDVRTHSAQSPEDLLATLREKGEL